MERSQSAKTTEILGTVNETNEGVRALIQKLDRLDQRLDGVLPHGIDFAKPEGSEFALIDPSQATELTRLRDENKEFRIEISKLRGIVTRSRRRDDVDTDDTIERHVLALKNGILQFVRNHMSRQMSSIIIRRGSSPDLQDLIIQSKLASALYSSLFSENVLLFGIAPLIVKGGLEETLGEFETQLKSSGCNEEELRNWRVATLRLSEKFVPHSKNSENMLRQIATQILEKELRVGSFKGSWDAAVTELAQLCKIAYELAIKFRASNIEYEWEQGMAPPASALPDDKAVEVVGIEGFENIKDKNKPFRAAYIVFGGVVRGDKTTGMLRDGTIRLTPSSVVKLGV